MNFNPNLYKDIIEDSDQIMILIDADYNIVYINKLGRDIFDWKKNTKLKCYNLICCKPEPQIHCINACKTQITFPISANNKNFIVKNKQLPNGYIICYLTDATNNSASNDKTKRKIQEKLSRKYDVLVKELQEKDNIIDEEREKFKLLFSNMNTAFAFHKIITDKKGNPIDYMFLECNTLFEKSTGLKKENIIGKTLLQILPNSELLWIQIYGQVALTQQPIEFTNFSKELNKYYEIKSYSPQKGYFVVTFNDITQRIKTEKKLTKTKKKLKTANKKLEKNINKFIKTNNELESAISTIYQNENILQNIFNSATSIMVLLNDKKEIVQINQPGIELTNDQNKSVIGLRTGDIFSCVESKKSSQGCGFSDACKSCKIQNCIDDTLKTKNDNTKIEAELNVFNTTNKKSNIKILLSTKHIDYKNNPGILVIIDDITELKKKEDRLKHEIEKSDNLNRNLIETKNALKIKLDAILNPEVHVKDLKITDIFEISFLQTIQNTFSKATGVSSIITDLDGIPITKPSNYSGFCLLVRSSLKGHFKCSKSDQKIGTKALELNKPYSSPCFSCGLIDGASILKIGNKPCAIWMIGQANSGSLTYDKLDAIATEFSLNYNSLKKEFRELVNMPITQFNQVLELLNLVSNELSSQAYKNLLLAQKNEELSLKQTDLIEAKENAEKANKLKSAFLANMSHEIRTPLNGVVGFSDFLVRGKNKTDQQKLKYTKIIKNSSDNLLKIIDDILDISKLENNSLKINHNHFSPFDIACDLEFLFKKKIIDLDKKINLKLEFQEKKLELFNDKERFRQILSNLIDNAIKFTHTGEISYGIHAINSKTITFFVKDTGIGISPKNQKLIFERFGQANLEPNRLYSGTGLGLSIVKELLFLMGGDISLESIPHKGSTFLFNLPVKTT